ncbi:cyclase family protein [Corynebacterium callunae]|uniref:cyclase family protein n=1 Tax=Corynebacterium callunae TaxID=1721 RepID=UPI001FFF6302|nr:cyclase family protein [Corynebacterium callunae]MCK2201356.1 cyclase family protein [Corynebacterium callunae]
MQIIDLSHAFHPGQPHYPGDPDEEVDVVSEISQDGFLMHRYHLVGPWGTHVDAPAHFDPTGRTLDQIPVQETYLPIYRVSFPQESLITPAELTSFESQYGEIQTGSFVALHTGWTWGRTGIAPGWSINALEYLHLKGVIAIGHDLPDTDPTLEAQHWWLHHDHWQIENMCNLEKVPPLGAHLACPWPVPRSGVSFPVRPIALIPD